MKKVFLWLRRDLRLDDNIALQQAIASGYPVQPLFIFDRDILDDLKEDDARVTFIYDRLAALDTRLREKGASLQIIHGKVNEAWRRILAENEVAAVYANEDYEPYAIQRDQELSELLREKGIGLTLWKDQVIFDFREVLKADGKPYTVFTPYKNKWLEKFRESTFPETVDFEEVDFAPSAFAFPTLESLGFRRSGIPVSDFDLKVMEDYAERRDFPAKEATSRLGPHLRFGTVSIREMVRKAKDSPIFLSELIWREFFMQILAHFPGVIQSNFHAKYDGIRWRNDETEFEKWKAGTTGYPLVDAGMRELNATGFMHNRVRMVVASFLCKHLLIDWRWGEAYFAEKLLDYELASNNGNWQWAAGTGCDAAPYFRVFNPETQLKKFDPGLRYVRKWVPEYGTAAYPAPMVEHAVARARALEAYKTGIMAV